MKALCSLPVAILVLSLSACASNSATMADRPSPYDEAYMAKVEQVSRGRGVIVKWVNPPAAKKQPQPVASNDE
jgi:hypothetical protein